MAHANTTARMSIDIPQSVHKTIKYAALMTDRSIKEFVLEAIQDKLAKEKIPNAETRKVFEETDAGIGLIRCDSAEEMFKSLEED